MLQTLHQWNGPTSIWQICWTASSVKNNDVDKPVARHCNAANRSISDIEVYAISLISGGNDSCKRHEKRLIFKIGTIHLHGLNERFPLIWSLHSFCFCLARVFIHVPLILFAPLPRLLINFKNRKWLLTYFCIYFCILSIFAPLSLAWLAYFLSHDYLSYINSLGC